MKCELRTKCDKFKQSNFSFLLIRSTIWILMTIHFKAMDTYA